MSGGPECRRKAEKGSVTGRKEMRIGEGRVREEGKCGRGENWKESRGKGKGRAEEAGNRTEVRGQGDRVSVLGGTTEGKR